MPALSSAQVDQAAQAWGSQVDAYAGTAEALTKQGAEKLVDFVQGSTVPIDASSNVVDVGAGTGVLSVYAAKKFPRTPVLATDIASPMLAQIDAVGMSNISTRIIDANKLAESVGREQFTHVLSTFMLQFVPNQQEILKEMYDSLKPGGLVGIGNWGPRMDSQAVWTKACQCVDPGYKLPDLFGVPGSWSTPEELVDGMKKAGFQDVNYEIAIVEVPIQNAERWAEFWFDTQNPAIWGIIGTYKGDLAEARKHVVRIARDEYNNAQDLILTCTMATGVKRS